MERLMHVRPNMEYKEAGIDYINEHYQYNSPINGSGGLQRYLDDYEGWLEKLESDLHRVPSEEKVPAETYYLVRESDRRIIGMINIRLALNERLRNVGGHIGYGIRPSERGKGYNKVNLYLALKRCQELGIDMVLLDCDKDNLASSKTMEALGGIQIREWYSHEEECVVLRYYINVNNAINSYGEIYEPMILRKRR